MKVRYIGDIHKEVADYLCAVDDAEYSVQIGDFGIGFKYHDDQIYLGSLVAKKGDYVHPPVSVLDPANHRFIRGNHDDPHLSRATIGNIADGTYETIDGHKVLYIGGARSIDAASRVENLSWWRDEELTQGQLMAIIDEYMIAKPDVIISHECPEFLVEHLQKFSPFKGDFPSITRQAFEMMMSYHQPKLWIFGHWHKDLQFKVNNTLFVCCGICSSFDVDYADFDSVVN